jgi:peptidoglycan/LPS O-acetylase OafA/YrhL
VVQAICPSAINYNSDGHFLPRISSYRGMEETKNRIASFDLLKAFALLYIIFGWHMDDYAEDILATTIGRTVAIGALGIFIFVSGFTLTRSCGEVEGLSDIGVYLKKRIIRIYPLYLTALIFSVATAQITGKQFLAAVFFLNAILNMHITVFWFVTMIFIFYLLLPLVLYRFSAAKALLISFSFIATCITLNKYVGLMDLRLAYYFPIFIFGVFCARYEPVFQFMQKRGWVLPSVIFLLGLTYIFTSFKAPWFKHVYIVGALIFAVAPLIALGETFSRLGKSKLLVRLSYASFCMYLFHRIVFACLLQIYTPGSNLLIVLYLGIAGFPLIFIVSEGIQKGYDFFVNRPDGLVYWIR